MSFITKRLGILSNYFFLKILVIFDASPPEEQASKNEGGCDKGKGF
jgi:hypothetical protein